MENLGAITFREAVLLVDPAEATRAELQRVADVICHELAHMWFGDLVTMKWWNGLWLNEAFATFMEMAAVDAFRPDWHRWVAFTNERAGAFALDSLASTRPIEFPVHSPAEAEGMFDTLTYEKGASVLRMLERFLGEDQFRSGIRRYLREHELGNAETTDLWDAIEAATGEPVRRIMDSWIFQGGHPLVSVEAEGDRVTLSQRRFRYLPDDGEALWAIPLLVSAGGAEPVKVLLDESSVVVELPGAAAKGVVVNSGGHGFYRVRYSPELLAQLRTSLDDLRPRRAGAPARRHLGLGGGGSDPGHRLPRARVWPSMRRGGPCGLDHAERQASGAIDRILDERRAHAGSETFVGGIVGPVLARLGLGPRAFGEADLRGQTRQLAINAMGVLGADPDARRPGPTACLDRELGGDPIDPNVAAAVVNVVASTGSAEDWERFLERYRTSTSPQEQLRYQYALGQFPEAELARRTLELCMSEFRSQNAAFVLLQLLANREVNGLTWEWLKANWDALNDRLPDNAIPRMLGGVTALSTEALLADVEAFLAGHPVPHGAKAIEQHLERLRVNVALRSRQATPVGQWLALR